MFDFRLQPVLNYKKQTEEKLMLEFAQTKAHLSREKETLKKLKTDRSDMISHLENMGALPMPASDVSAYFSYINYMGDEENRRQEVVCKVEKDLEEKRVKLIGASRNRRILEIIKEKKLKEYEQSLLVREQKELDEAGILRV
jgi:flagellar FliJ protein